MDCSVRVRYGRLIAKRTLLLLVLLLVGAVSATATNAAQPPRALRADADCGAVDGFGVHVTKGNVSCDRALEVAKKELGLRSCGSGNLPACVADGFHCREASFDLQRKTGIGLFCYTLKRQLPASKDRSPYRLSLFTRAITIYAPEE